MCTLILVHRLLSEAPLLVVANRDEYLNRPAMPPRVVQQAPRVFCGIDELGKGTWAGLNEHGLFVGVTNLTIRLPDPSCRSRGLLCLELLGCKSAKDVSDALSEVQPDSYNPFNLVASDGQDAIRVRHDASSAFHLEKLGPGLHVTTNWPDGAMGGEKKGLIEEMCRRLLARELPLPGLLEELSRMAGSHGPGSPRNPEPRDPRTSICCHAAGYGTRCSSILAIGREAHLARFLHCEGSPCECSFQDLSDEVAAMLV